MYACASVCLCVCVCVRIPEYVWQPIFPVSPVDTPCEDGGGCVCVCVCVVGGLIQSAKWGKVWRNATDWVLLMSLGSCARSAAGAALARFRSNRTNSSAASGAYPLKAAHMAVTATGSTLARYLHPHGGGSHRLFFSINCFM